jgi:Ulp1 family protease
MDSYDQILCPYNSGQHWELVVVLPHRKTLLYIDPLGELDEKKNAVLKSWKTFINRRFSEGLEAAGPSKWKIETVHHSKQQDSVSCGVYVMKVSRKFN